MCVEDPTYINGITKRLYHDIATKRNTVATRVERAIRHAIILMFNTGSNFIALKLILLYNSFVCFVLTPRGVSGLKYCGELFGAKKLITKRDR